MAVTEEIQRKVLAEATSATPNYDIDYNDPRFGKVESDKNQALTELEQTYAGMIGNTDQYYDKQIQASKDWADKQTQLQQEQTDFAIEQINQQKDQAHKDYLKEQSASYVDFQKQSNKYGANAEQMASAGLWGSGFSESSQVGMYNTYQNRVATARESYAKAVLNYNNAIKDAQLQNNAALAEIAFKSLQQQLELSLAGFQYKNQLILEQANKKTELDNMYYNRYQDVLEQINKENAVKEDIRQYNETMAWNTEQKELDRQHDEDMAEINHKYQVERDEANRTFQKAQAELDRKHDLALVEANTKAAKERADHEHKLAREKLAQEHKNALAKIDKELAAEKALLSYQKSLSQQSYGGVTGRTTTTRTSSSGKTHGGTSGSFGSAATTAKFTGSTYEDAVKYMKSKGVSSAQASGIMTMSEWSRRKSSAGSAASNYSTYKAYLAATVEYYTAKAKK